MFEYIPHISTLFREGGHLQLYPVHPVDAVNEQDEDEDKCDLKYPLLSGTRKRIVEKPTLRPYCNFAITGLSETKVKSLRLTAKGRGTIRPIKTPISRTRRQKTCSQSTLILIDLKVQGSKVGCSRLQQNPIVLLDEGKSRIVGLIIRTRL